MRESDTENRGSRRSPELYDRLGKGQYERKKNSRGTKAWPCETCTEPWLWAGKGISWSSSGAITRQHGSVAALPHRLRVCRPRPSKQGVSISLQKAQCAAMLDAACCDDHRSALRRHMHRLAFFGPMFSVCSQSEPYGSTRPGTPTLQSCSCILHILFHWGEEHNRRFRTFLSIVQRKLSKSLTSPSPLSKESSPNHQQVTPLCSKEDSTKCPPSLSPLSEEVLQTVCAFRFIAPNNFLVRQSEAIGSRKSRWPAQSWMGLPPAYCYPPPPRQTESACKRKRPGE